MEKRQSGLDVLRCTALLLVVLFHSYLYNGYYSVPQKGAVMVLTGGLRWFSTACVGTFLMLTGYLKSGHTGFRSCWRGLVGVVLGYLAASAVSIPVRHFLLGDRQSFGIWLQRLLSFSGCYYGWYVGMYIGLLLLAPFLNRLLNSLRDKKELLSFAGILLFITALPGATPLPLLPVYWRSFYPVTYYVLGAVIARLQPKLSFWLSLLLAAVIALLMGLATTHSTDGNLSKALTWEFADIWTTGITVLLFLACYRIKLPAAASKIVAFGAVGCYGGYLLSHLLDAWCYAQVPRWNTPDHYWKQQLCITLPIFLISLLCGWLLETGVRRARK